MIRDIIVTKILLFIILSGISTTMTTAKSSAILIDFYGQEIALDYDDDLVRVQGLKFEEAAFSQYLKEKEKTSYQNLLRQLSTLKQELLLNDWMYYDLLQKSVAHMLRKGDRYERRLLTHFLLSKSGYDSKITYLNNKMWVNVYTDDNMYEISTILLGDRNYVNLTAATKKQRNFQSQVYLLDYVIAGSKRAFSFEMNTLPLLSPRPKKLSVSFNFKGKPIILDVTIDLNMIDIINNYPIFDEISYLETPLSPTAVASLKPQLNAYMEHMNEETKLEFLASITRMAFKYKEDYQAYGKNKPMIAEELFFYDYSDCEDRCALFYNLNKITLDLPLLVIALPDHLSIAVAMIDPPSQVKNAIDYQGKTYYFCDPTGPFNAHHIGSLPKEYQNSRYEILSAYK